MTSTPAAGEQSRPEERRIEAKFQPQAWINDYAVDIDGSYTFDVTDQILAMGRDAALALEDYTEETDRLWLEHPEHDQFQAEFPHHGPFAVSVETAIALYYDAEDAADADTDRDTDTDA